MDNFPNILVTGAAGFIGFHLSLRLLKEGYPVHGLDNLNDYYDVTLKEARLKILQEHSNFTFYKLSLEDKPGIEKIFQKNRFTHVANLAAQAGVRYSLENPHAYVDSNLVGFVNILEGCRHNGVDHLAFASSSSVYGANTKMPFSVGDNADHPISLYAASKKANELFAHSYSHLYGLACTGLRLFTVYGPWGRPDMALFKFTKAILEGDVIDVYNRGNMSRDFTYIDDIVEGVFRVIFHLPEPDPKWDGGDPDPALSYAPYRIYNIGNNSLSDLMRMIEILENVLGKKARKNLLPMQPGDVPATAADIEELNRDIGFVPSTPLEDGIPKFVEWYREFYGQ